MKKQNGFTLIELVVVIIILGILAVTAAPKFINLQSDARLSALAGMKASIQGANSLVYSKAAIAGKEKGDANGAATLDIGLGSGNDINIVYGYIKATEADFEKGLDVSFAEGADGKPASTTATDEWIIKPEGSKVTIWQKGAPAACKLEYTEATSSSAGPTFTAMPTTSNC
ncbi:type II secretion system protein [Shewanella sp.]|uniref:type II secretion system protein n=1 Tax=Shewanella sp. TaxID=50422 RepID=UPI003D12AD09